MKFNPQPKPTPKAKKSQQPIKRSRKDSGYKKLYLDFFGFKDQSDCFCEICGTIAIEVHHIEARGMGGTNAAEDINNLMAVCRACHVEYGDKKKYIEFLNTKHQNFIKKNK